MNYPYVLSLITFIGFNIASFPLYVYFHNKVSVKTLKTILFVVASHIALFACGISLIGDYIDYTLFSIEYLISIISAFGLVSTKNWLLKIPGFIMLTIASVSGLVTILLGFFLFIIMSQDYEADKVYNFNSNGYEYQTRRYSYGFVTSDDITYSFATYRRYAYLPIEYKIDYTYFSSMQSDLNFNEPDQLKLKVINKGSIKQLKFTTYNNSFEKDLK